MKHRLFVATLVVTTLLLCQCRSPRGNVNPLSMGKSRPTLVQ